MIWPAPCPIDTIVVTAAIPMTTPSTVSPERSLFFPSIRSEIQNRSNRLTALPRCQRTLRPNHHGLIFGEVARNQFRELVFDQPQRDRHCPQERPLPHPDRAVLAALRLVRLIRRRVLGFGLTQIRRRGHSGAPPLRRTLTPPPHPPH